MKDIGRHIREGLARAGIITADNKPGEYSSFDVAAVNGRIEENVCCRVFSDAGSSGALFDKAWIEYEVSSALYKQAPELFIRPVQKPLPFEADGRGFYALLTEKSSPLSAFDDRSTGFLIGLMADICRALDVLHSSGCIHSCLKPSSIVIKNGCFCLTGFGDAAGSCRHIDQFTAPEVIKGFLMSRSDIYSLAMVIRYMMTGINEIPQYITDTETICERKRRLLPLYSDDPLRDRLLSVVNKAASYSPYERHSSASVLLRELDSLIADKAGTCKGETEYEHVAV